MVSTPRAGRLPLSKNQINALGDRLAASDVPSEVDVAQLNEVLRAYQTVLDEVKDQLSDLGLQPTTRIKTTDVLLGKLRREGRMQLARVQDIAGARIVISGNRRDQNEVVRKIKDDFEGRGIAVNVKDRRAEPSHGYRAVHVIVSPDGVPVEIQVRTELQNYWAQIMEGLADRWGRGIRYGEQPESPGKRVSGVKLRHGRAVTRIRVVHDLLDMSEVIERVEIAEAAWSEFDEMQPVKHDVDEWIEGACSRPGAGANRVAEGYRSLRRSFKRLVTRRGRDRRYNGRVIRSLVPPKKDVTREDLELALRRCDHFVERDYALRRSQVRRTHEMTRAMLRSLRRYVVEKGGMR